jgi:hypothetical protein
MLEGFVDVSVILRPAVYALVRNGVVVYIGQASKAAIARVEAHRSNWGRKRVPAWMPVSLRGVLFDQIFVFPCKVDDLDAVEVAMINLYKPRYNIQSKTPNPPSILPLLAKPRPTIDRRI